MNTSSGWILVLVRTITGLIGFRLVWGHLQGDDLGFWHLLWSLIGVGVFIDLGLGVTAMRAVVRYASDGDERALGDVVATCFWTVTVLGLLLAAVAAALHRPLLHALGAADSDSVRRAWLAFVAGLGLMFPISMLPEILRGCHRMVAVNVIAIVLALAQVVFLALACALGAAIDVLVAGTMALMVVAGALNLAVVRRALPALSLSPGHASLAALRGHLAFSASAYALGSARVLMDAAPSVALGLVAGLPQVALFQAVSKPAQMMLQFGRQVEGPMQAGAGQLYAEGKPAAACRLGRRSALAFAILVWPGVLTATAFPAITVEAFTGDPAAAAVAAPLVWMSLVGTGAVLLAEMWRLVLLLGASPGGIAAITIAQAAATVVGVGVGAHLGGVAGTLLAIVATAAPPAAILFLALRRQHTGERDVAVRAPALAAAILLPCVATALSSYLAPDPLCAPLLDIAWRLALALAPFAWSWRWILRLMVG
ncbi:MAG: oligosaccharide flippase family protein [Planctomycetes bacterium]|nr:oligosaccharide flippase family protein [Planctomycetota bacterium]